MKLIGAGLPRTATMTQKIALEMLGLAPCYHMANVMGGLDNVPRWLEAFLGNSDWDDIFGDYLRLARRFLLQGPDGGVPRRQGLA